MQFDTDCSTVLSRVSVVFCLSIRECSVQITRRIYVSLPAGHWLPPNLNALKWGVVEEIEKLGYTP